MDSEFDEEFRSVTELNATVGKVITEFDIPMDKRRRFVWVGLDAYNRVTAGDFWYMFGELRFLKNQTPIATIPLRRGNIPSVTSLAGGGSSFTLSGGGAQPAVRFAFGACEATCFQWFVDLPCSEMEVQADRVQLYLKTLRDYSSGGTTLFVTGLRIQSQ